MNAGAKWPMNIAGDQPAAGAKRNVTQVATALAVPVANAPHRMSSTLIWVAQTLKHRLRGEVEGGIAQRAEQDAVEQRGLHRAGSYPGA